jgi:putative ABC transport system substrate-binding protein
MRRRNFVSVAAGALATWPITLLAQRPGNVYRIAILLPSGAVGTWTEAKSPRYWRPFFEELRRLGYAEGQNLTVQRYSGEGETDRYAELARTVTASGPDVIFVMSARMALFCKAATTTIPIVAMTVDPVLVGLASSLAHPGGNITGVVADAGLEIEGKYLELLRQVIPSASRIAYLTPRAVWESDMLSPVRELAPRVGVSVVAAALENPIGETEYRRVFANIAQQHVDAVIVGDSSENSTASRLIIELAESYRLPALYTARGYVEHGGLMSYGIVASELSRHAADAIGQVLGGADPGNIPFYRATAFELVVNLKTANALGLTVPQLLLAQAAEVIE